MVFAAIKSFTKEKVSSIREAFDDEDDVTLPQPLGLRIGASVEVDHLDLKFLQDKMNFTIPTNVFMINAYGHIDFDESTVLHRFYTDETCFFQVVTNNDVVEEIKLFSLYHEEFPTTESEWETWLGIEGHIGQPTFVMDDTEYERAWLQGNDVVDPVDLEETIYTSDNSSTVEIQTMLYARWIEPEKEEHSEVEWLLASFRDKGESTSIVLNLGVDLPEHSIKIT